MRKLRIAIIIISVLILITIVICIIFNSNKKETDSGEVTEFETRNVYEPKEKIERVKDRNIYFTTQMLVDRYLEYIKTLNDIDAGLTDIANEAIYNILDDAYKSEFNITEASLNDKYQNISINETVEIKDMYIAEFDNNINILLIKGRYSLLEKDMEIIIKMDTRNTLFSVFPEEYIETHNISENISKEDLNSIGTVTLLENEYNKFKFSNTTNQRVSVIYFNDWKNKIISNPEKYYDLLDEDYRNKRFGSVDSFKQYVESNKNDLSKVEVQSYLYNNYENYNEYVCKDQYENIYIFRENYIMGYTVLLDDYTLDYEDEEYLAEYASSDDQYKVAYNINKWIKMLNNRDYNAAYNVLDETFRNENFGSIEKFEEYMRQYFPAHYTIEYGETTKEEDNYIQKITLKDVTGEDTREIQRTIIMRLKDETDFVMSFNFPTKSQFD